MDITAIRTPLGLVRMWTLPIGATNSIADMHNAMNRILQEFILAKTRPFLDDIPIKRCLYAEKDETLTPDGLDNLSGSIYAMWNSSIEAHQGRIYSIW
jgi:hypothetical protein